MTAEVRHGRYQDVLADIECDAVIVDPPYGARVHNADGARADGLAPAPAIVVRRCRMSDATDERKSIEERCADFDTAHPEVYAEIKRLALKAHADGRRRLGIGFLAELARWNLTTDARDDKGYKLNNDYRSLWSRRLVAECPQLAHMFVTRERTAA